MGERLNTGRQGSYLARFGPVMPDDPTRASIHLLANINYPLIAILTMSVVSSMLLSEVMPAHGAIVSTLFSQHLPAFQPSTLQANRKIVHSYIP